MNAPIRRIRAGALALLVLGLLALALPMLAGPPAAAQEQEQDEPNRSVLTAEVDGPITSVVADYLVEGVQRAEREGHQAFVVNLNTPGGFDVAMREIVQTFLDAQVPVIVYVTPPGGRAASAGALITFSADVAAMTMGTTIGAATPVDLQGGEISDKVVNDAAAFARSVAEKQGHNADFAEATVREGKAVTAREAAAIDAIDLLAPDRAALLQALDGRTIELGDGSEVTLQTAGGVPTVAHEMGKFTQFRQLLADPNLAFLFISIGSLALIFELANPGAGIGGVIGAVLLILGFVSLSVLPITAAGLLLLALAVALFVAELFTSGVGVFAAGGAIALAFAGLLLFDGPFAVNSNVLWPLVLVVGLGTIFAGRLALRARQSRPVSGRSELVGQDIVVEEADGVHGRARVDGSWWTVIGAGNPLAEGEHVRVVDVQDLTLVVEPLSREEQQ